MRSFCMGLYSAPSPGSTSFCGPTAIAAATGRTVEQAEDATLDFRKRAAQAGRVTRRERNMRGARIKTMYSYEIAAVCKRLGFAAIRVPDCAQPKTFRQLSETMQAGNIRGPAIVLVTGHYIAISRWQFVDNAHRDPTLHDRYRTQRDRVKAIWLITPLAT